MNNTLKLDSNEVLKLDIGCGLNKQEGHIGLDIIKNKQVDVVHDFNKTPFPFKENMFTLISCACAIQYVNPVNGGFFKFMDECWRVLKFDGQMRISTPYGGSTMAHSDPAHLLELTPRSFFYLDPLHESNLFKQYKPKPWKMQECYWSPDGIMEVLLVKRRIDKSYYEK